MGAGASVYQRSVGSLWNLYNARTGWLIREGRVVFAEGVRTETINTLETDHNPDSEDNDIEDEMDTHYAEVYDGPLADDPMNEFYLDPEHPRYNDVYDRVFGPVPEPEEEAAPTDEEMVSSSSSSSWEPFTNTRGGGKGDFDWDWIPDFETESE